VERKLKIGSPATCDLDAARRAAREALAIVDRGGDPAAARAALREAWTVGQAVDAYLMSPAFTGKTRERYRSVANLHIKYRLGSVLLSEISIPRTRKLLAAVTTDTRVNVRNNARVGGPGTAIKVARVLSAILSWCVDHGQLARNPLLGALRLEGDGEREC
jgi:hypothetical protein